MATTHRRTISIRWALGRDLPHVVAIEQKCFDLAWSMDNFVQCLNQKNCVMMVAEWRDRIIGFMVYELHRDCVRLLNMAVDPELQRSGAGSLLMKRLVYKVESHGRKRLVVDVRETNATALRFFRRHCLQAAELIRGHYEDTGEDGIRMELWV